MAQSEDWRLLLASHNMAAQFWEGEAIQKWGFQETKQKLQGFL